MYTKFRSLKVGRPGKARWKVEDASLRICVEMTAFETETEIEIEIETETETEIETEIETETEIVTIVISTNGEIA